ncbi:MAG: ORF6N domain-containing protein [Candidatus Margulisiibacteriota bacterium]
MIENLPIERIEKKIYLIRGQKVMIDRDLAELYGVSTSRLNEQVRRNLDRFPEDFMFQLTEQEFLSLKACFGASNLMSQNAISSWGGTRKLSRAFTEQGVAMLSTVLRSKKAVYMNIVIMRAFVNLRQVLATHKELANKFKELESRVDKHDSQIVAIFDAIRKMITYSEKPVRKMGFRYDRDQE